MHILNGEQQSESGQTSFQVLLEISEKSQKKKPHKFKKKKKSFNAQPELPLRGRLSMTVMLAGLPLFLNPNLSCTLHPQRAGSFFENVP